MRTDEFKIDEISGLILKKLSGEILSIEEERLLKEWFSEDELNRISYEDIMSENALIRDYKNYKQFGSGEKAWKNFSKKMEGKYLNKKYILWPLSIAASLLLVVYVIFSFESPEEQLYVNNISRPASSVFSLVIDDGRDSITWDDQKMNDIQIPGTKQEASEIIYGVETEGKVPLEYHKLNVGKGGKYQITLSDGTKIWLNSSTSVRYPNYFAGNRREIEVEGEAFFEVAPDPERPFFVNCGGFNIEVLGTSFNVMNYPEEEMAHVTLATGSLKVQKENKYAVLSPNQQARLGENHFTVARVDTRYYTSWMKDVFMFDEETLEVISRKLNRWYGWEFEFYDEELKYTRFSGAIPKYMEIFKVFEVLEMTTNVKFNINKNLITVMKKE